MNYIQETLVSGIYRERVASSVVPKLVWAGTQIKL